MENGLQSVTRNYTEYTKQMEKNGGREMDNVELGAVRKKGPRRVIHFASGETMEEYSTDEEEEEEEKKRRELHPAVEPGRLTWGPYVWFYMIRMATSTLSVCDFVGEKIASVLGISTPKYQYAIDEYYRMQKEEEEEEEENRMSEEAERQYMEQKQQQHQPSQEPAQTQQPDSSGSFVNINFEMEGENQPMDRQADRQISRLE